eukprot:gene21752-28774_t
MPVLCTPPPRSSYAPVSIPRLATYRLRQSPAGISPAGASTSFAKPVSGRGPVHARAVPSLGEYSPPVEDLAGVSRVLLQFKHDLRVEDWPDRMCLSWDWVDEVLPAVARSVGAEAILTEQGVIHEWGEAADRATQELVQQDEMKAVIWSSTVWNPRAFNINFKGWKAKRGDAIGPLKTHNALPAALSSFPTSNSLPSPEELWFMLDYAGSGSLSDDDMHEVAEKVHAWADNKVESKVVKLVAGVRCPTPSQSPAQQQLAAELATAVSQLEIVSSGGASFPALFGPMLSLGTLSRHRCSVRQSSLNTGKARLRP